MDEWRIEEPVSLDLGGDGDAITDIDVTLVEGRVSVVAAEREDGSARLEINEVRGAPLTVTLDDGRLRVSHPKSAGGEGLFGRLKMPWREMSAQVSITAPAAARVSVKTVSADALVSGSRSAVKVKSVSGPIVVDAVSASLDATTVSGAIEVRDLRGSLKANSVSGDLTVHARDLPDFTAKSVSGDVTVDLADADSGPDVRSTQSVKTVSGEVTVRIPAAAGYVVHGHSMSGQLVAGGERVGGGGKGGASLRSGSEAVRLDAATMSGDITVLQADPPAGAEEAPGWS
jgi:hypothetical protein